MLNVIGENVSLTKLSVEKQSFLLAFLMLDDFVPKAKEDPKAEGKRKVMGFLKKK